MWSGEPSSVILVWPATFSQALPRFDSTRLTMAVRIATTAVAHVGGSEGFAIGCRSRHNFPRSIGRRLLPYKAMNLFPGRVLGRCRVQPEPIARLLTHRPCMRTISNSYSLSAWAAGASVASTERGQAKCDRSSSSGGGGPPAPGPRANTGFATTDTGAYTHKYIMRFKD
ncbi:hypothetical protein EVAR_39824_1 [Eumeta japonica]|uniref:Uncharacterized protein n=1 Tax=Eumeta variegata TaxID=151549 RepID=A0A4C1XBI3_EUMVA|nr:hypothetical protein EVAR_39824_1 [Eumeta japonica]